jgi:hypothetical protein
MTRLILCQTGHYPAKMFAPVPDPMNDLFSSVSEMGVDYKDLYCMYN